MDLNVRIEFNGEYIELHHPAGFEIEPRTMSEYWALVADACKKHRCSVVLVEAENPRRRMGTMDAFGSGIKASEISYTLSLALCFTGYEPDDLSDFFKTVARNRGVRVEFFSDRESALKWLGVETARERIENVA